MTTCRGATTSSTNALGDAAKFPLQIALKPKVQPEVKTEPKAETTQPVPEAKAERSAVSSVPVPKVMKDVLAPADVKKATSSGASIYPAANILIGVAVAALLALLYVLYIRYKHDYYDC